jgi:hypothetical protein
MRSTDFPFAVMPQRLQRGGRPDYSAPSADVADLLDPTDIVGRGRLEARETSWRDKLKDELAVRFGRRNAEQLLTLADFTPLAGAFVGNEAALAVRKGKRGEAAANVALAALPLPGAGKAAKKVAAQAKAPLAVKPQGITAYHGSPYDFDRFDISKIGTGEGAQAYGHGLYFAENEGVAREYREGLSRNAPFVRELVIDGRKLTTGTPEYIAADLAKIAARYKDDIIKDYGSLSKWVKSDLAARGRQDAAKILRMFNKIDGASVGEKNLAGRMYQVRINANPADFLDYDAPLSGQSEKVRSSLSALMGPKADQMTGQEVYQKLSAFDPMVEVARKQGASAPDMLPVIFPNASKAEIERAISAASVQKPGDVVASSMLTEAGIPGIKYLDQGSRTAGDGSRNYVVFDDKLISILKRYGWAPGMAIPAAAMEEYEAEQELARGGFAVKKGR